MQQLRTIASAEPEGPRLADAVHPELPKWMADSLGAIARYTASPAFQQMYARLRAMTAADQARFVRAVLLDPDELARREMTPPDGIVIQRSEFHDQRPTIFCVSRRLPTGAAWQRVTVTFDDVDSFVPRRRSQ